MKTEDLTSFEDVAREINKTTLSSPMWRLWWNMLGIVLFHMWKKRNQRRMQATAGTRQQVLRRSIEMAGTEFEEAKFKQKCRTDKEVRALLHRDALIMLIHDKENGG